MTQLSTLVAGAADRDQNAWAELVAMFSPMMRSIAAGFRLTGDEGADAAQTTWMQLLVHVRRIREPDRIAGWLAITMRHECGRIVRRRGREQMLDDWMVGSADDGELVAGLLRDERNQTLWRVVDRLPAQAEPPLACAHRVGPSRARALCRLREMLAEEGIAQGVLELAA